MSYRKDSWLLLLHLAVEKGDLRFKEAEKALKRFGIKSSRTVSKHLHKVVDEGLLEKFESEKTKRPAYRATPLGLKYYALWQAFNLWRSLLTRIQDAGIMDSASADDPLIELKMTFTGLFSSLVYFIPEIRAIDNKKQQEQLLNIYIDCITELYNKLLKQKMIKLLDREDADRICRKWLQQEVRPYLEDIKRHVSKFGNDVSSKIPEIHLIEAFLREIHQSKQKKGKFKRIG